MEVWTEILNENAAAVHFECDDHRYKAVAVPLSDDATIDEYHDVMDYLEERALMKQFIRQSRRMRENVEKRQEARETLNRAGYDLDEIPI